MLSAAEGAWVLAEYEDARIRQRIIEQLRQILAPLPMVDISLVGITPDPLAILKELSIAPGSDAPVVSFTGVGGNLPELCGYLELQRDSLARLPHRLIFWVTEYDIRVLAEQAPNFYSRISGTFRFLGRAFLDQVLVSKTRQEVRTATTPTIARRRPIVPVKGDKERRDFISNIRRRIQALEQLPHTDKEIVADSWYDLAGLYEVSNAEDRARATEAYLQAAKCYGEAGNRIAEADALVRAGIVAARLYEYGLAKEHFLRAWTLYQALDGDNHQIKARKINVLWQLGHLEQDQGNYAEARRLYNQSLKLEERLGDRSGAANTMNNLGILEQAQGNYAEARRLYNHSLQLYKQLGDQRGIVGTLHNLAILEHEQGNYAEARRLFKQSLQLYDQLEDRSGAARSLRSLATLEHEQGNYAEARRLFKQSLRQSLRLREQLKDRRGVTRIQSILGILEILEWYRSIFTKILLLFRRLFNKSW